MARAETREMMVLGGRLDISREGGVWVVGLVGEHDLNSHQIIRAQLHNLLSTGAGVVVDLSEATFIESTVIGALVSSLPPGRRRRWPTLRAAHLRRRKDR